MTTYCLSCCYSTNSRSSTKSNSTGLVRGSSGD